MNLFNLGLSGLNASQARLNTVGHNIANADTDGYNRQSVVVSSAGGVSVGAGFVGRGVQVDTVKRSYDSFLYKQLTNAQSSGAAMVAYGGQISQVSNLLADNTVGVAPALRKFFESNNAVASAPADPAARQDLIGQANSLVTQINEANRFLQNQRENINAQISTSVSQINSYVERINDMNQQIARAQAASPGHVPNDMYDQRDQLVTELNTLVKVNVIEQNGSYNITVGNGQTMLSGTSVYPLQAVASKADGSRLVVAYTVPTGQPGQTATVELQDGQISGGQLGGLLDYRANSLDVLQNDLGRMAVGLAVSYNAIHEQGLDANGRPGQAFFGLGAVNAQANANNSGAQSIGARYADIDAITGNDYQIKFDGAEYQITRMPGGAELYRGDGSELSATPPQLIEGLQIDLSNGTPRAGDSWVLQPTRNAARDLSVAIGDPSQIAAAGPGGGSANGENALALAQLQTKKVLGNGTMSLNESFSQLVNKVGVMAGQNATASKAQANLIEQNYAAQQAVSGVNVDEEYVNLDRYMQQYRASSRLIDVGSQIFDTLLGLRG